MTAYARTEDPATSHEAAATVDTNASQAAVLRLIDHLPVYFTQRMVVRAYQQMQALQEAGRVPDRFPRLADSRVRTAVRELERLGLLAEVGYTDPPRGQRRELVWTLPAAPIRPGGPWTTHGHIIPGVTQPGPGRPNVARCGGVGYCTHCTREARAALNVTCMTTTEESQP